MAVFSKMKADKLSAAGQEALAAARKKRWKEIEEDVPDSVKAYRGEYWPSKDKRPSVITAANEVYSAWMSFIPHLLHEMPRPFSEGEKGFEAYGRCVNMMTAYADRTFKHLEQHTRGLLDCFLRGKGVVRSSWDYEHGCARTDYADIRRFYFDDQCSRPDDANHLIEEHRLRRWEAAERFGREVAGKLPTCSEGSSPIGEQEAAEGEKKEGNDLDMVKYYLLWTKHDGEDRVIPFSPDVTDKFLWTGRDGLPGDPFPFPLTNGRWHIDLVAWNWNNENDGAFSYFHSVRGPIKAMMWADTFALQSLGKSAKQIIAMPRSMAGYASKIADVTEHLPIMLIDDDLLQNGETIESKIKVIEFPAFAAAIGMMQSQAAAKHAQVGGLSAVSQIQASKVETSGEATQLADAQEARVKNLRKTVEAWVEAATETRTRINADRMRKRAVLCVKPKGYEDPPEGPVGKDEDAPPTYEVIQDVPYEEARLLIQPIPERLLPKIRQLQVKAALQTGQMSTMGAYPEVDVRNARKIPLDSTVELEQPGAEYFVGPELAEAWVENPSDWEIKTMVKVRVEAGSSTAQSRMNRSNEVQKTFSAVMPFFQEKGLTENQVVMINAMLAVSQEPLLEAAMTSLPQVQQAEQAAAEAAQQQMQAEQEAATAQQQQQLQMEAQKEAMVAEATGRSAESEEAMEERRARREDSLEQNRSGRELAGMEGKRRIEETRNQGLAVRRDTEALRGPRDRSAAPGRPRRR